MIRGRKERGIWGSLPGLFVRALTACLAARVEGERKKRARGRGEGTSEGRHERCCQQGLYYLQRDQPTGKKGSQGRLGGEGRKKKKSFLMKGGRGKKGMARMELLRTRLASSLP